MHHWNLTEIETPDGSRSPAVLHSQDGESLVVLIELLTLAPWPGEGHDRGDTPAGPTASS